MNNVHTLDNNMLLCPYISRCSLRVTGKTDERRTRRLLELQGAAYRSGVERISIVLLFWINSLTIILAKYYSYEVELHKFPNLLTLMYHGIRRSNTIK